MKQRSGHKYRTSLFTNKQFLGNLRQFVDRYNKDRPISEQVRNGVLGTAEFLLIAYLQEHRDTLFLLKPGDPLPSLEMRNPRISRRRSITNRTALNHRQRLEEAQVIVCHTNHGPKDNYELWLNPELIWGLTPPPTSQPTSPSSLDTTSSVSSPRELHNSDVALVENSVEKAKSKTNDQPSKCAPGADLSASSEKNFPPNRVVISNRNDIIEESGNVESGILIDFSGDQTGQKGGAISYPNNAKNSNAPAKQAGSEKREVAPRNPHFVDKSKPKPYSKRAKPDTYRTKLIDMYTDWVLNILLEVLYPYQEYDQQQLRRTRAYIQQWFVHLPQERWGGQYQDMIEGIGMAGKWVEKSPKRYVVVPWLYMDLSKRRYGFVNVMELWLGKKRRGKSTTWSKLATRNVALQMIGRAFREGKQGQDLKKVLDHAVTMVRSLRCERSWNAFARMVEQMATDQAVDMSSSGHSFHRRAV